MERKERRKHCTYQVMNSSAATLHLDDILWIHQVIIESLSR